MNIKKRYIHVEKSLKSGYDCSFSIELCKEYDYEISLTAFEILVRKEAIMFIISESDIYHRLIEKYCVFDDSLYNIILNNIYDFRENCLSFEDEFNLWNNMFTDYTFSAKIFINSKKFELTLEKIIKGLTSEEENTSTIKDEKLYLYGSNEDKAVNNVFNDYKKVTITRRKKALQRELNHIQRQKLNEKKNSSNLDYNISELSDYF